MFAKFSLFRRIRFFNEFFLFSCLEKPKVKLTDFGAKWMVRLILENGNVELKIV